ncbi:hypothetical protein CAEBREN_25858 [Caenorhabditis brenneri]|uniref:Histone-lysine N-methyltransferase, H3 lysine-79 specific n=1 Tax=Caenorhabditis brenneri TaxID=135651 RepID=G0MH73_CAEBE|nr:hypothetical protein CAEBREN_25858 [Caenorhabditis brenneri]
MNTRFYDRKTRSQGPAHEIQLATDRIGRVGRMGQCIRKKIQTSVILLSPFDNGEAFKVDLKEQFNRDEFAKLIARSFSDVLQHLKIKIPSNWKLNDAHVNRSTFLKFTNDWNEAVRSGRTMTSTGQTPIIFQKLENKDCPKPLLTSILDYCKDVTIRDEGILKSASYGDKMYGAVSDKQVLSWANELDIGASDTVVDLGSGIGNIVCLLGPSVNKAVGIEFVEKTAEIANAHHELFAKVMSWLGIHDTKVTLKHADMLDPQFENLITKEATVVVINNKQFGPDLMNKMNILFAKCETGIKIISTIPLIGARQVNSKLHRDNNPLVAIGESKELMMTEKNTNFQSTPCQFHVTTIDRNKAPFVYASVTRR